MSHTDPAQLDEHVRAFDEGRAVVRVDARVVRVVGTDARRWLDDLITAGIGRLRAGEQTRSLLLSPTGRIRADLHIVDEGAAFLLVQRRDQPASIAELLERYVLSSDVGLDEVSGAEVALVAADPDPQVLVDAGTMHDVTGDAYEAWRIRRGAVSFPVDLDTDSTPAEGELDRLVDTTKGCFLGQEAVAKIRNLGHPARIAIAVSAPPGTMPGDDVTADGRAVGIITSIAPDGDRPAAIARVAWRARDLDLAVRTGPLASR